MQQLSYVEALADRTALADRARAAARGARQAGRAAGARGVSRGRQAAQAASRTCSWCTRRDVLQGDRRAVRVVLAAGRAWAAAGLAPTPAQRTAAPP